MRIHAGTSGTLPREVGRSLSGQDQVFLPGKKKDYEGVAKTGQSQPKDFRASKTAKRRQGLGNIKKRLGGRRKKEEKGGEGGGVLSLVIPHAAPRVAGAFN